MPLAAKLYSLLSVADLTAISSVCGIMPEEPFQAPLCRRKIVVGLQEDSIENVGSISDNTNVGIDFVIGAVIAQIRRPNKFLPDTQRRIVANSVCQIIQQTNLCIGGRRRNIRGAEYAFIRAVEALKEILISGISRNLAPDFQNIIALDVGVVCATTGIGS